MTTDSTIRRLGRHIKAAWTRAYRTINPMNTGVVGSSTPEEISALERHSPIVSFLVDEDRRVRSINKAGQQFSARTESEAVGLRAGRALRCVHAADSPQGCGYGGACLSCGVRNAVNDTLETGAAHRQKEATLVLHPDDGSGSEMHVLVSTCLVNVNDTPLVAVWLEDVTSLKQAQKRLTELARTDSLTGLRNRRQINEDVKKEMADAERHGFPLSVAMVDVDGFKSVNDNLGHDTGDILLQKLADLLKNEVRAGDVVGRYGGDEFLIILPHTDISEARVVAERVRRTYRVRNDPGESCSTTLSIGVGAMDPGDTPPKILKRADEKMYEAKRQGGDCTVVRELKAQKFRSA